MQIFKVRWKILQGRGQEKKAFKNFQHSFTLSYQILIRKKISVVTGKINQEKEKLQQKESFSFHSLHVLAWKFLFSKKLLKLYC